ncbi:MAG: hypothetical protein GC160_24680 [Acidobacteria bacterium]|nr:hypothetical protein [Acidobacteriota bacterium]
MRGIILLVLTVIALAILRMLVNDVTRAVSRAFKGNGGQAPPQQATERASNGRFVRDPQTGAFVDEDSAIKARVGEKVFYFESESSRDAYLRKQRA